MMGSNEKPVQLKVFIDKKKKKVIFAEAEEDFVDILFSFFMLPLGTIARHSSSTQSDTQNGSFTSLYESIVDLNVKHFTNELCRDALVNPRNSSASVFQKLKVNLDDRNNPIGANTVDDSDHGRFVKKSSFIITDDLNVLPVLHNTSIILLNSLGFHHIDLLDERTMRFGVQEFSNLLKWSLVTNNPLTNLVFGGTKSCSGSCLCSLCITNSTLRNPTLNLDYTFKPQTIKLLVQKSKRIVLCAEVKNFFVELLFSFLTIPLGTVKRLTMDDPLPMAINNLYHSITSLRDGNYLKSEDVKTMLLHPKIADIYLRVTEFLPIYEPSKISGCFIKEQATFIVSDDLKVTIPPSTSTISMFNTLGIPDLEVVEMCIGEQEAFLILKASLTSTSVLTDCLNAFTKKRKAESSS